MTKSFRSLVRAERTRLREVEAWIAWIRLAAVPFVAVEVAVERGNYPSGYERWAWITAAAFAVGAVALFVADRRARERPLVGALALAFDVVIVSAWVVIYSFEPSSPVRQLLLLPVIEAGLRYGRRGGVLVPLASAPALAYFELRASDRLDVPYDPGHVAFPVALQVLVGLIVGALAGRR